MKRLLIVALALSATSAFAASGDLEFIANMDGGYPTFNSQFEVEQNAGNINGVSGSIVDLQQQKDGYQGFALGRPFNVTCCDNQCTDNGPTQLDIKVTPVKGGYKLSGTLNYVFVNATVTDSRISVSASGQNTDVSFDLTNTCDGMYQGNGVSDGANSFTANLTLQGSLVCMDPATFIVAFLNAFVNQ